MTSITLSVPTLADIRAARDRIARVARRTPLLQMPRRAGEPEVWLKLETLQPIGSFKIRGAANVLARAGRDELARGVGRRAPATWRRASRGALARRESRAPSSCRTRRRAPSWTNVERLGGTDRRRCRSTGGGRSGGAAIRGIAEVCSSTR